MAQKKNTSIPKPFFEGFEALPSGSSLAGYSALIVAYKLRVPLPDYLCAIGEKHKNFSAGRWRFFTPRYQPANTLLGNLTFALKYEGIDLYLLKSLFVQLGASSFSELVQAQPTGAYARRIWFLYEWLCDHRLPIEDLSQGNFVYLVDEKLQFTGPARDSRRHRIRNNLPGHRLFCPMIRRTKKIDDFISKNLTQLAGENIGSVPRDLVARAAAFLLLKDSQASFTIEGETPSPSRIQRWGSIVAQAGANSLSVEELERLQRELITDKRFVFPGLRLEGGFIGDHDRQTGLPLPVHISARAEDLDSLCQGLLETANLLASEGFDAVLLASLIAFGFVFIHPFEDGNGRIHRYLIHHVLAEMNFVPKGLVFPVSTIILQRIDDYKKVLEHFSTTRLNLIQWKPSAKNNVEVLNNTVDLYRYFDATVQAEFLYECVEETVRVTLPEEVDYLRKYDDFFSFVNNHFDMPDKLINLLIRFLSQNAGSLSKRSRSKEFQLLADNEVNFLEQKFKEVFGNE